METQFSISYSPSLWIVTPHYSLPSNLTTPNKGGKNCSRKKKSKFSIVSITESMIKIQLRDVFL